MDKYTTLPTRMHDEVHLPPEMLQNKPLFHERPSDAEIAAILDYIRDHQTPHLWPGHSHTEPPHLTPIVFLAEYELTPESAAPCPCCSPSRAKYFRQGMVVWFPEEGVIRLMGWQCYKTRDPAGISDAYAEYKKDRERRNSIAFILRQRDTVLQAIVAIDFNIPIAAAFDEFQSALHSIVYQTYNMPMADHIKEGVLTVGDGEKPRRYASIRGWAALKTPKAAIAKRFTVARQILEQADTNANAEALNALSDEARSGMSRAIQDGLRMADGAAKILGDIRQFASVTTASTLRNWGMQPGCPCEVYARREGNALKIGKAEHRARLINLAPNFDAPIAPIPEIIKRSTSKTLDDPFTEIEAITSMARDKDLQQ